MTVEEILAALSTGMETIARDMDARFDAALQECIDISDAAVAIDKMLANMTIGDRSELRMPFRLQAIGAARKADWQRLIERNEDLLDIDGSDDD